MALYFSRFFNKNNYINFLFSLIPLSFIIGNLLLNLNIILLIVITALFYGKDFNNIKLYFLDKLIIFFFAFSLFVAFYNYLDNFFFLEVSKGDLTILFKTIAYLRYLFLYFTIRYIVEKKIVDFKLFFISSSFFSIFVSLDIFYQFIFGQDIFNFKPVGYKFAGPFNEELIAGGYIQRFSLFTFFFFSLFLKSKNKFIRNFLIPILFLIIFLALVISGNRMPLILFLLALALIVIFEKKTRKYLFWFLTTLLFFFFIMINSSSDPNSKSYWKIKGNLIGLTTEIIKISKAIDLKERKINRDAMPGYYHEFEAFYDTWLMNKYIGGGIKSFRINCPKRQNLDINERTTCNTHPHNYYLEILTDLGFIGFFILFGIFIITFYISFIKKYLMRSTLNTNHLITPFMILFFIEIFPLRTSGSFFTTGNFTFIILMMSITIALSRKQNLN